jgi:hypothetical protein
MPVTIPEPVGAPDAIVIPMHNGRATKKTTTEANPSCLRPPIRRENEDGTAVPRRLFIGILLRVGSL